MVDRNAELASMLRETLTPAFRGRLLDRGIARSLIWTDGFLPDGSPGFANSLSEDLLDYAYTIMSMALRIRAEDRNSELAKQAFFVAGEAIRSTVHRGALDTSDRGFHQVNAAVAFHLAGYSAMAFSVVPTTTTESNLAPTEEALVFLFRRRLQELRRVISNWLRTDQNLDQQIAVRLRDEEGFEVDDAAHTLITTSFMRGLALFDHAIAVGESEVATSARELLRTTSEVAGHMNFVNHWWMCTLAWHLIDDLWSLSLHECIPTLPSDAPEHDTWNILLEAYIHSLLAADHPTIELWPSQLEAARRATDVDDNLVVALPTSAGKTRIAELCILRTLASERRIIYLTPLRALSAQVERDLAQTFLPLGYSVSSLYTSVDIETGSGQSLRDGHIVVSTPEKLNFALRNDPSLIDEVGLIVLDEGHTLGPGEREVRYEVLIESLLKREDSGSRRLVSLSALFPSPNEMAEMVDWIRQGTAGGPIHSEWRPTNRRFGTIQWMGSAGRLDISVEGQSSFVPRFIEPQPPPEGSRRRRDFPNTKNELTLAAAWRFVQRGQRVFVYCPLRSSVEVLGKLVLRAIDQGVLTPIGEISNPIQEAINTGAEWLGIDHPAVQCLQFGVALHHGGLPRPFLNEVERLLRMGECPLVVASPTLAQGLNLSASVLLIPSIWRNQAFIPSTEFANVAGRAGRAFVDLEGLVLHIIWEKLPSRRRYARRNWEKLVKSSGSIRIVSGLLDLTIQVCIRIADQTNLPFEEILNYVTSNEDAWDFRPISDSEGEPEEIVWESQLASLDSAILTLLDPSIEEPSIQPKLLQALEDTLYSRKIQDLEDDVQTLLTQFMAARAQLIWSSSNPKQRQGIYSAGVGYRAGVFLNSHISHLVRLLLRAESAIQKGNTQDITEAIVEFAELVCLVAPFRPNRALPEEWRAGLSGWLEGRPASAITEILGNDGVDFLQDTVMYRLPWAMESVRAHARSVEEPGADELTGLAAMVTELGSTNLSVTALIQSGLRSREAASRAVEATGASFVDREGMQSWLASADVQSQISSPDWPTAQTRHEWNQFYQRAILRDGGAWSRDSSQLSVTWHDSAPVPGTDVILQPIPEQEGSIVLSPEFIELGVVNGRLGRPHRSVVRSRTADDPNVLVVEFFGPD